MKDAAKPDLYATIVDEYATVEAFASLLAFEEKALCSANSLEHLSPILDSKTALIEKLATLETQRDQQLAALGLPAGWIGMEAAAADDARLAQQWALLQQSADRARRRNTTNGVLIRVRMDYNRRALNALSAPPAQQDFYGPDGRFSVAG
jgi:flagella synthesis protein FlgN